MPFRHFLRPPFVTNVKTAFVTTRRDDRGKVKVENVEKIDQGEDIQRDDIYKINKENYRVLSVFKKIIQ